MKKFFALAMLVSLAAEANQLLADEITGEQARLIFEDLGDDQESYAMGRIYREGENIVCDALKLDGHDPQIYEYTCRPKVDSAGRDQ